MKPVLERACRDLRRLVFAEGEDERVLRALQVIVDDGIGTDADRSARRSGKSNRKLGLRLEE